MKAKANLRKRNGTLVYGDENSQSKDLPAKRKRHLGSPLCALQTAAPRPQVR